MHAPTPLLSPPSSYSRAASESTSLSRFFEFLPRAAPRPRRPPGPLRLGQSTLLESLWKLLQNHEQSCDILPSPSVDASVVPETVRLFAPSWLAVSGTWFSAPFSSLDFQAVKTDDEYVLRSGVPPEPRPHLVPRCEEGYLCTQNLQPPSSASNCTNGKRSSFPVIWTACPASARSARGSRSWPPRRVPASSSIPRRPSSGWARVRECVAAACRSGVPASRCGESPRSISPALLAMNLQYDDRYRHNKSRFLDTDDELVGCGSSTCATTWETPVRRGCCRCPLIFPVRMQLCILRGVSSRGSPVPFYLPRPFLATPSCDRNTLGAVVIDSTASSARAERPNP